MNSLQAGETPWFQVPSGEHAGRWCLRGWIVSSIQGPFKDGWLGDKRREHERWHARTDCPVPGHTTACDIDRIPDGCARAGACRGCGGVPGQFNSDSECMACGGSGGDHD